MKPGGSRKTLGWWGGRWWRTSGRWENRDFPLQPTRAGNAEIASSEDGFLDRRPQPEVAWIRMKPKEEKAILGAALRELSV